MTLFSFTCYGEPIPKKRPRLGRNGVYTPTATTEWEKQVSAACLLAMYSQNIEMLNQPLRVDMTFYRAGYTRVDLDNLAKAVLDALNGLAYSDDHLVVSFYAFKHLGAGDNARVEVLLVPIEGYEIVKPKKAKRVRV